MKTNVKKPSVFKTAPASARVAGGAGAVADKITAELQLRRCVMACLLWEDLAYENGKSVTDTIKNTIPLVDAEIVSQIAIEAREKSKLRHVPLYIVRVMASLPTHKHLVAHTLERVIQRADELAEFLAIYWKEGKTPISNQVKKGLAKAFLKFNEYSLAKYNREGDIKLRDVLFLCHARPIGEDQANLWKRLINNELAIPYTWEVELSSGKDKTEVWTSLLEKNALGPLALLRNLRNITEAKVDVNLVRKSIRGANPEKLLPFNFVTAVKYAPQYQGELEHLMFKCLSQFEKIKGKTVFVVDVSGSMGAQLSSKSELSRLDAAAALTMLMREICEEPIIYATAGSDGQRKHKTELVPLKRGFDLSNEISKTQFSKLGGGGIFLSQCTKHIEAIEKDCDRLIVFSDSQDCDYTRDPNSAAAFGKYNYLIDISAHTKGVAYKKFTHIDGFSEAVITYIQASEKTNNQ